MITTHEAAWLAGLWDGEGSVGIAFVNKRGKTTLRAMVQMSMTCETTIKRVLELFERMGCRGHAYTYEERDPSKHKDAWFIRCNRMIDVQLFADTVLPYSVTKHEQWSLMHEYVSSRLEGVEVDDQGRIVRGGTSANPFTEREFEIAEALRELNRRGPRSH